MPGARLAVVRSVKEELFALFHPFGRHAALSRYADSSETLVVGEGFEPSKSVTADLQSAPFGRSGTPPDSINICIIYMVPAPRVELGTY